MKMFEPIIITETTPQEVYDSAVELLEEDGKKVEVRGKTTKELLNVNMISSQPGYISTESIDLDYIYSEISNILSRRDCHKEHPEFVKKYLNPDADRRNLFWGVEVRSALNEDSLQRVADYLNKSPSTRRAVLGFTVNEMLTEPEVCVEVNRNNHRGEYHIPNYVEDPSEVPCLTFAHFIRRRSKLHMQVQTRSADIHLGVPYDYYLFQNIHQIVAARTDNRIGDFMYKAISLHKYVGDEDDR